MRRTALTLGLSALCLGLASPAWAYSAGITTNDLAGMGCNNCHSGGNDPLVSVVGPQYVRPLSTHTYTALVSTTTTQLYGGFNASSAAGVLSPGGPDDEQTQLVMNGGGDNEITHLGAKEAKQGFTKFSFQWTAPAVFTSENINVWGNAVDLADGSSGDKGTFESLTVENGDLGLCPAMPSGSCRVGGKSSLAITDSTTDDAKDSFAFAWSKGILAAPSSDFGDPTASADYYLCLYRDNTLLAEIDVPGATTCGSNPCWVLKGDLLDPKSIQYKDKVGAPSGVRSVKLSPGLAGKAKLGVKAKGLDLPDPAALPIGMASVTIELRNTQTAVCFGDTYSGVEITKDDGVKFKAKASNP